jgi:hypothetical protein
MLRYGYGDFLDDISKQLVVGIVISGLISFFVPEDFFSTYVGNTYMEMLIMIVGGIPLYVCATASIPIAMALMMKGVSPGAAFVFLAVGPATNAATITLIGNVMGRKIVGIYLGTIAFFSVAAGLLFNGIVNNFFNGSLPMGNMAGHIHNQMSPYTLVSIFFLVLLTLSLFRSYFPELWAKTIVRKKNDTPSDGQEQVCTIGIEGMTCKNCVKHVTEDIQKVQGITGVQVSLKEKSVKVSGAFEINAVKKAITGAGYTVVER